MTQTAAAKLPPVIVGTLDLRPLDFESGKRLAISKEQMEPCDACGTPSAVFAVLATGHRLEIAADEDDGPICETCGKPAAQMATIAFAPYCSPRCAGRGLILADGEATCPACNVTVSVEYDRDGAHVLDGDDCIHMQNRGLVEAVDFARDAAVQP